MMKKFLIFLLLTPGAVRADVYATAKISSGTYSQVTLTSATPVAFPNRYMNCLNTLVYTNNSSSDTIFISGYERVTPSSATMFATATPIFVQEHFIVDVDPLGSFSTFYFLAGQGSGGADLRVIQLGCPGGFRP